MEDRERTLVVLLSMHRCGSSLTAHVLQELGMSLGPFDLNGADTGNPYGHFEAVPFLTLNRQIQNLAYGFMDDLPESPEILARFRETNGAWDEGTHIPEELLAAGRSLVRTLVDSGRISGFKDPRTVLTWPFWERVLADFPDVRTIPLGLVRSPHEIAMSLVTRRGGWRGYWTSLDVVAVHYRRLKLILDGWDERPACLCFGSPSYLRSLERAVAQCGLTWNSATVLDLFDRSDVHQRPAAVAHEAQDLFEAICDGEAAQLDAEGNRAQQERDARFLEELRLQQWHSSQESNQRRIDEESRRHSVRMLEVEDQLQQTQRRLAEAERERQVLQSQLAETERGRHALQCQLLESARQLIQVQEREIQAWQRNEQLQNRLHRFECHPLLGPVMRGRRRLRRIIHSIGAGPASNGSGPHHG